MGKSIVLLLLFDCMKKKKKPRERCVHLLTLLLFYIIHVTPKFPRLQAYGIGKLIYNVVLYTGIFHCFVFFYCN